jgi:molybdate transport system substrate-binding protein
MMKTALQCTIATVGLLVFLLGGYAVQAAEVRLISTAALSQIFDELRPEIERATGNKLTMYSDSSSALKRRVEFGAVFDAAVLSFFDLEDLIKQERISPGTRTLVGHSGVGVGVRKGTPKPDISTTEAFRRTLLSANSVAYGREGGSGVYFTALLSRLGIAEEMKAKLRPAPVGDSVQAVARGDAEIVVNATMAIVNVPGVELAGWLPRELQNYSVFSGGVSSSARDSEAGRALLQFLTTRTAISVLKAKGLEPIAMANGQLVAPPAH